MRIDRLALSAAHVAGGGAPLLGAQDPLTGVGPATEVRSIAFRFIGDHVLEEQDLRGRIALTARGSFVWLRNAFAWLPLISPVGQHLF